jgi:hypothetical protein
MAQSKKAASLVVSVLAFSIVADGADPNWPSIGREEEQIYSWCGKYCMSFWTRARSAKTVGKGRLSVSVKAQHFDWTQVRGADDNYHSRASGQERQRLQTVLCTKYGWAENHHIAVGVPYWFNDFDIPGKSNDSAGLANIYVFEKWNFIRETNHFPGVAVDFWYYFPSGDTDRKLGTDDSAYKITTEVSKAWKDFSLHLNPGYTWSEDKDEELGEINAVLLLQPHPSFWPGLEYNYIDQEHKGHRHDLVPGFIWRFAEGWSFKLGVPINLDSTFTDRDRVGIVLKLFRRW